MIHIDSMYDGDGRVRACVWERMTQLFDLEMLCVCVIVMMQWCDVIGYLNLHGCNEITAFHCDRLFSCCMLIYCVACMCE